MTLDDLLIDKRIVRRNLEKGRLDETTYARLLAELPDRSGNLWRPEAAREPERAPAAPAPAVQVPVAPMPAAAPAAPAVDEERAEPSTAAPFSPMASG
jgi:hypothetical protein